MYIRKPTRSYKGKSYTKQLLVESVHTRHGPRQRTICSLGSLAPAPADAWSGGSFITCNTGRRRADAVIENGLLNALSQGEYQSWLSPGLPCCPRVF